MKLSLRRAALGVVVLSAIVPSAAAAQEPSSLVETTQATGPSMPMVGSGLVVFGLAYVPAVAVGATTSPSADRALLVPIAGPWIDLTQRPGCPAIGTCNTEYTNKVLLITDGVFQALGTITVVGGVLSTGHETRIVRTARQPTLRVAPGAVAPGGYGMVALGTF